MLKPRVRGGGKEDDPQTHKKGGEKDERRGGHAKLPASQPQQSTYLLQAGENHAEVACQKNRVVLGAHSHLRADL